MAVVNQGVVHAVNKYIFQHREIVVIFDDDNKPWFKAKDIADILGYVNTNKTIGMHVKDKHRKTYQEIRGTDLVPPLNQQYHIRMMQSDFM